MTHDGVETTNNETKEAWHKNWKDIGVETILEIFDYPRVKRLLDIVRANLPETGGILEAGCGLGPWVIKLGEMGYDVTGIDYQEGCVEKIKAYDKKQKVYAADVRKIPFDDGSFGAYLSFGVIEHFAEGPDEVLKEANRVLGKDGRLILSVPYGNIFIRLKAPFNYLKRSSFIRGMFKKPPKVYYYQKYYGVGELEELIRRHGFTIEKTMPVDHIFSLVEFSRLFRNGNSYDGENALAVVLGKALERILPWPSAGSILVIASKQ